MRLRRLGIIVLLAEAMALACPMDNPEPPTWNPVGKPAYLSAVFGQRMEGRYAMGVELSAPEGSPVHAPEAGRIVTVRETAAEGLSLQIQGISGHVWVLRHLSWLGKDLENRFWARKSKLRRNEILWVLLEAEQPQVQENEVIAYSGNSGHGGARLGLELRDPVHHVTLDPCEAGVACHDSLSPRLLGAAAWDAARPDGGVRYTSTKALDEGCLEVDPSFREPRLALKMLDESRIGVREPLGLHWISLRQGTRLLYQKAAQTLGIGASSLFLHEEVLESQDSLPGFWYSMSPGSVPNPNIQGHASDLSMALRNLVRLTDKKAKQNPLTLEMMDARFHSKILSLKVRSACSPKGTLSPRAPAGSPLFTFLARPWIDFGACDAGVPVSLLDSAKFVLERGICDSLPHQPVMVSAILARWPETRTVALGGSNSHAIAIYPLSAARPVSWNQDGVTLSLTPARPLFPNALAWERQDSSGFCWLDLHPKGLPIRGSLEVCMDAGKHCLQRTEFGRLDLTRDVWAPEIGSVRTGEIWGPYHPLPVLWIAVREKGSGIPNGDSIQVMQGDVWIPVRWDGDHSEIEVRVFSLQHGLPLEIAVHDAAGNVGHARVDFP
ncbi:MAG TPA: M23 family metallopeptidase [Fibrobacteraceae bacterium]|nr:M23 family metallopeptidase [Fibrobacteraceae bacterium]